MVTHYKEFLQFIAVSKGSLAEVETQIMLAERFNYIDHESMQDVLELSDEVNRMLTGLQKSLRAKL